MKGRYAWEHRTEDSLEKALELFQKAIDKDANFADAYVGKANTLVMLGYGKVGACAPNDVIPQAREAAQKALEIDPDSGEAKATLAWIAFIYEWRWNEAEELFKEALALKPLYATAYHWYAHYLVAMQYRHEAVTMIKQAEKLAITSPIIGTGVGIVYYFCQEYEKAIKQYEKTIEDEPSYPRARFELGRALEQLRDYKQAIAEFQTILTSSPDSPRVIAALGHAYALSGEEDKAREMLQQLEQLSKQRYVSPGEFARIYIGLNEKEQVLDWLYKALDDRSSWLPYLKVEPMFDSLRSEPRFQDLVRKVGLP
jgi:tetratricopeptide (TPR) repeat protein